MLMVKLALDRATAPGWYDSTKSQPASRKAKDEGSTGSVSNPENQGSTGPGESPESGSQTPPSWSNSPRVTPDEAETEEEKKEREKKAAKAKDCNKRAHDARIALDRASDRSY